MNGNIQMGMYSHYSSRDVAPPGRAEKHYQASGNFVFARSVFWRQVFVMYTHVSMSVSMMFGEPGGC